MTFPRDFRGAARRLDDIDLPKIAATIGVTEDHIHAVLDVESRGSGFDRQGRPLILFEPHVFYRQLGPGAKRDAAVRAELAYAKWGARPYPPDSYPRLIAAMAIDETAALKSASWGLGQILGSNFRAAGYATPQAMVAAMCEDEEHHLAAMVKFIVSAKLDGHLRARNWARFAAGYNGPAYAKNRYDVRLAAAFARWSKIRDTPWTPASAARETQAYHAVVGAQQSAFLAPAAPPPLPPAPPAKPNFLQRFAAAFKARIGA